MNPRIPLAAAGAALLLLAPAAARARSSDDPQVLRGHVGVVSSVAFVGGQVASGGIDGTVRLWDARTGEALRTLDAGGEVYAVALSPDGGLVAAGHGTQVTAWTLPGGRRAWTRELNGYASALAFSPDGRTLAALSRPGMLLRMNPADGAVRDTLRLRDEGGAVAFSRDGRWMAAGGSGIRIWPAAAAADTGRVLAGHRDVAHSLAFSPDGAALASASLDYTARLWSVVDGAVRDTLITAHPSRLRIGGRMREIAQRLPVTSAAFSPDGATLATAGGDRAVHLWNPADGERRRSMEGHTRAVTALAFGPDGRLASSSADGTVRLWTVAP